MALSDLVNPHIRELAPYEPGKPLEELERELGVTDSVKLASNENPLGPSPKALAAMQGAVGEVFRYPDGACFALRAALAPRLGVDEKQLVFGCGGDEILELVAKTFMRRDDEVVFGWPSFAMYPIVTKGMGAVPVRVPLDDDFTYDLDAILAAVNERTRVVMLCNPNNPTGTSFDQATFDAFVSKLPADVVLVVDEAYYEYVRRDDFPDTVALTKTRPGTLVLRTFSKIYGLAGLRIGYGICDAEMAGFLERARHPFNVNRLAEVAALAALDDVEHVEKTRAMNDAGARFLTESLEALGCRVWPTDANYLLVEIGPDYYDKLLRQGVIVRPMAGFGLNSHLRISIGTAEENERLIKAIEQIRESEA